MMRKISVLCAARDCRVVSSLSRKMDDGEHCTFRIVDNGDAAIRSAKRYVPDILVLDAVLPNVDGLGVIDRLRAALGDRMPRVIAGSMMPFTDAGFRQRGVETLVRVPWEEEQLHQELVRMMDKLETQVDWARVQTGYERACALLTDMGMRKTLHGFLYLAWAAALVYDRETRLDAIGERLYRPIAERFLTTPQNVERLIRHAVESTMDSVGAKGIYGFFGNTIDPTRGKPTNAQMIGMLAQRLRLA